MKKLLVLAFAVIMSISAICFAGCGASMYDGNYKEATDENVTTLAEKVDYGQLVTKKDGTKTSHNLSLDAAINADLGIGGFKIKGNVSLNAALNSFLDVPEEGDPTSDIKLMLKAKTDFSTSASDEVVAKLIEKLELDEEYAALIAFAANRKANGELSAYLIDGTLFAAAKGNYENYINGEAKVSANMISALKAVFGDAFTMDALISQIYDMIDSYTSYVSPATISLAVTMAKGRNLTVFCDYTDGYKIKVAFTEEGLNALYEGLDIDKNILKVNDLGLYIAFDKEGKLEGVKLGLDVKLNKYQLAEELFANGSLKASVDIKTSAEEIKDAPKAEDYLDVTPVASTVISGILDNIK